MNFELGFVGVFVFRGLESLQIQWPLNDLPPPHPPFKLTLEDERKRFFFFLLSVARLGKDKTLLIAGYYLCGTIKADGKANKK